MARFAAFLNLMVGQAIRNGDPSYRWMSEGWEQGYVFELGLVNQGQTYEDFVREYEEFSAGTL